MRFAPHEARQAAARAALWLAAGLVLAFMMVPILAILPLSFNDGQFLTYPLRGVSRGAVAHLEATQSIGT